MGIRVSLYHKTEYRYDRPVHLGPQVVRLRPAPHCRTPILAYSLKIRPEGHFLNWQQDPYSNYLARLVFPKPVREFVVEVDLLADLTAINPFDFFIENYAEKYPFVYEASLARELIPYLEKEAAGPRFHAFVERHRKHGVRTIDHLVDINHALREEIDYVIRLEPGLQSCEETMTLRRGSCRDSAWVLVQVLRHLGLAARFVSGYSIQLRADVLAAEGPVGVLQDVVDLHAWAEVYLPGAGWIGMDATSGMMTTEGHIPLACAADPLNAAPITGAIHFSTDPNRPDDQLGTEFNVVMKVERINEIPRVTKPYTEEEWRLIEALGHEIDMDLVDHDVRLTMGGEPTFVSVENRDAPEWNTTALGAEKRQKAGVLIRRLRDRFAPGGLLHFGQGKWYPGESLPRWALGLYWRKDGEPIWTDPQWVADEKQRYGFQADDAQLFIATLAEMLGVDPNLALPGYEDVWYYLWRERRLPINLDPHANNLDDPEERARLAKVFDQGLARTIGYALPLRRSWEGTRPIWESGAWFFRREQMYLIPGDSPMGFRLPLDSLPWAPPEQRDALVERDGFFPREPLGPRPDYGQARLHTQATREPGNPFAVAGLPGYGPQVPQRLGSPIPGIVRTALCVEPRQGFLYVFAPPVATVEDYLDLMAAVEATAAKLKMPVLVEGYPPPYDPRIESLKVTPDPGVLEVNIHAARSWDELVRNTTALYEEAHQAKLSTEKFMLDGRHTGTCGGNHIVVGGPTPSDSPFLRRPDLLRSLLGYWQNHPSLSFLFSSLFVGPTSQAPRIDEARNDSLYEMELAFRQIPQHGPMPYWLVDRLFRNLLIDASGNTHRTEICIDKLYSPDSASGRLGLVELRAFEMPPHERMSLVQHLLLRALIARFWKEPYQNHLVRWGTELHDRFMLPHFVWQDFCDVVEDMQIAGYPLKREWFIPHFEFRFPMMGKVQYRDISLEFRTAIEPWHVLGEEPGAGGTVRYVDSSLERLEVKVRHMTDPRHVVAVNGRRVPLTATGVNGEFVAGVRYRAWQPPACLHPTIGVHTPLVFDLIDTWNGRSVGGATYHVAHPGGRSYENFPVNANEAECRRSARFWPFGHTIGPVEVPPEERSPEMPLTLDLRQPPPSVPKIAPKPQRTASRRSESAPNVLG